MSVAHPTNLSASVKQRLLNLSRYHNIDFNALLTNYALERFLYRISISRLRDRFILKGALLFWIWTKELHRTTRDADFLDLSTPSLEGLALEFREICEIKTESDGIRFIPESVQTTEIRARTTFKGIRINLLGMLGKAKVPLQIDIGFGDACVPPAEKVGFPVLLDFPVPHLLAYVRETMIAEKFHAAVELGMRNSRMKDYFDIYFLSQKFFFRGEDLLSALTATFDRQNTPIPGRPPLGLSIDFAMDSMKRAQWKSFLVQTNAASDDKNFLEVIESVRNFLMPVSIAAANRNPFNLWWEPGGPWKKKGGV